MAIKNEGSTERINGTYRYVLRLYGHFINGQKALVTLVGIQVFFDTLVPDRETPDECEEKVNKILSSIVKSYKIEHIKAFPFSGYYTEKKTYLRIYTNSTGSRKTAIKAVQDNNFETASDDLYSFHHKDIEMQSQKLGEFAEVLDLNHNVFMICMTLYWKDDPKPLKQICIVDESLKERTEEIIKWKYREKIGAKSENDYMKKYPVKAPEEGEEDPEENEYMGGPIKIKISAEEVFTSSFLELPGYVPIDV
ncbi:hypothetical protein C1646_772735 [Rhizophagus diaphanus]|nr:hypothetical protein C1646_772735 [Rhizophagus diaphanus] [Rhizophagus sp. MUCL 43196]